MPSPPPALQTRLNALNIIDELFLRSKQFRGLLTEDFSTLLLLAVGHKADKPLPPPASAAQQLRQLALECVERWDEQFGALYGQARLLSLYRQDTQLAELMASACRCVWRTPFSRKLFALSSPS